MANQYDCRRSEPGGRAGRVLLLASILALFAALAISGVAQAAMSWHIERVQTGYDSAWQAAGLEAVSCPSEHLCVAVGDGAILVSQDPGAPRSSWRLEHASGWGTTAGIWETIACPSEQLCVGTTEEAALTSTNPAVGTWQVSPIDTVVPASLNLTPEERLVLYSQLACPSASFCVAQGAGGEYSALATTTDPAGGSSAWRVTPGAFFEPARNLVVPVQEVQDEAYSVNPTNLACAPEGFCLATRTHPEREPSGEMSVRGIRNETLTSTTLQDGYTSWQVAAGGLLGTPGLEITGLACPSASLCLATDSKGRLLSSSEPGNPQSWRATEIARGGLAQLTCASASFCAMEGDEELLTSTDPTGGPKAWSAARIPTEHFVKTFPTGSDASRIGVGTFLSCPTSHLCVGVRGDEIITGTPPATVPRALKPARKKHKRGHGRRKHP